MTTAPEKLDLLLAVPFQPIGAHIMDPTLRQTLGAHYGAPLVEAMAEFERVLGHPLGFPTWSDHPLLRGDETGLMRTTHRSLTAVALATHLEKHRINWAAVDPGEQELRYWRRCFAKMRSRSPRAVAISTTFIMTASWLKILCALARKAFPNSKLLVGGSYYVTNTREFLSLDADVFCIGEGEHRLPEMVRRIRDGNPLDDIPGLYLRGPDGTLKHTGPAAPLDLDELPPVDWTLARRIEPAIESERDSSYCYVETQRGCAFRCEFCDYHTLTPHKVMSPVRASEEIVHCGMTSRGYIFLVDATATFPHKRWKEVLERIVERGGPPHPVLAFARVTDIKEDTAELMARARVQELYIGQESGDQRLLNAMKKGTLVQHVAPAVSALGKFGVGAHFCFIHGFPGESTESLQATRSMITSLNRGFEKQPVVFTYMITPFHVFDFAPVARRDDFEHVRHHLGYEAADFSPQRAGEEVLATIIAASRVPDAPVCAILFEGQGHFLFTVKPGPRRYRIFRWLKALERGVAIFLERHLEGTPPDDGELRGLRETVLADYPAKAWWRRALARMAARVRARETRLIRAEWLAEKERGPGKRTKNCAAFLTLRDLGRLRDAFTGWKTGTYPDLGSYPVEDVAALEKSSAELIQTSVR